MTPMAMPLKKGAWYRGRLVLDDPLGMASKSMVSSALTKAGFVEVSVWFEPEELPADWLAQYKDDVGDFMERTTYLQGKWDGKDDQPVPELGDDWKLYDMWQHATGGEAKDRVVVEAQGDSGYGTALAVAAGVVLFGLPLALLLRSSSR